MKHKSCSRKLVLPPPDGQMTAERLVVVQVRADHRCSRYRFFFIASAAVILSQRKGSIDNACCAGAVLCPTKQPREALQKAELLLLLFGSGVWLERELRAAEVDSHSEVAEKITAQYAALLEP